MAKPPSAAHHRLMVVRLMAISAIVSSLSLALLLVTSGT
jgi:hypothetical protein